MAVNAATTVQKTVADPCAQYESLIPLWIKSRAVCRGERYVKEYDKLVDIDTFKNLLIPFSPSMSQAQYNFYKAEAELPGITSQFAKTLIGGLLRKQPLIKFPEGVPDEVSKWIIHQFGKDDSPMSAFLDEALWEELQTSFCWVLVDHPDMSEEELAAMTPEQRAEVRPYPVIYQAESVINWRTSTDVTGRTQLDRLVIRGYQERYSEEPESDYEFHPEFVETVWVHELVNGFYQVRVYEAESAALDVPVINGEKKVDTAQKLTFKLKNTVPVIVNGKPGTTLTAWPLSGKIEPGEPILNTFVDKETALYNKISRRNHLMYGAATYTPWVAADLTDEKFGEIVDGGLGTWLNLGLEGKAGVLATPHEALDSMEKAIAAGIEEMAKLGIRMMSPENDQSGVALDLRNAAQTAQMGSLNNKVSNTMKQIICFMVNWRYELTLKPGDIEFTLSSDFNPTPLGADWLRLVTEWYQAQLIPRSVWLLILRQNDILSPDYDDEAGKVEVTTDMELSMQYNDKFAKNMADQLSKEQ
jgi:hypothetical protein